MSLGQGSSKLGSKGIYAEEEKVVIVELWKRSEEPCGKRLKPTIPLWLGSCEKLHGMLSEEMRGKILEILQYSPRQLDRITAPPSGPWN